MKSCGKINLFLGVKQKRPDGYHEIETIFWPLTWLGDDLEVTLDGRHISIECTGFSHDVPTDARNLCWKAAQAFLEKTGLDVPVHIVLKKKLPVAAGLGGGSSNAASVLLKLKELLLPDMDVEELRKIAAGLGADVPFFLHPVPSAAYGIGDEIVPIPVCGAPGLFLANPGFPVTAAWAYQHWRDFAPEREDIMPEILSSLKDGDWEQVMTLSTNDLEHCIFHKFPMLKMLKASMEALGIRNVHVSGSGPTLFGFTSSDTKPDADRLLAEEFGDSLRCFYNIP